MQPKREINFEAWARNAVAFIREKGLEPEFRDWSGGFPCPVDGTSALIAAAPLMFEALKDTLRILKAVRYEAGLGKKQVERIEAAEAVLAKVQS